LNEVKKVFQNFNVENIDVNDGLISVSNNNYFIPSDYTSLVWSILENGKTVHSHEIKELYIAPQQKSLIRLTYPSGLIKPGNEYFLNLSFRTTKATLWADKSFEIAAEQIPLDFIPDATLPADSKNELKLITKSNILKISGKDFIINFDKKNGSINKFIFKNKAITEEALLPYFWRVPTDNDEGGGTNSFASRWREVGLDNYSIVPVSLEETVLPSGEIQITATNVLQFKTGNIKQTACYIISENGKTKIENTFVVDNSLPPLARVGMLMILPSVFNEVEWYGKGPFESYEDRKDAAFIGIYSGKVKDQHFPYVMPQENGNKTDVRWLNIRSSDGYSIRISGKPVLNFNIQDYSCEALNRSKTSRKLKRGDKTWLHIDYKQMGLGGDDSWTPRVHREFLLNNNVYKYACTLAPAINN
jgi:beta-galactosidase